MHIIRSDQAPGYEPPGHVDVSARRLQGLQAGGPEGFAVGLSHYPPGAAATMSPTVADTVYVVLDGEFTLVADGRTETLRHHDSVHLPAGQMRALRNDGPAEATLLVVTATTPEGA